MSRSGWQKEKYGNSSEFSQNNINGGTAARTRPFSFDEIMLRRKSKKQPRHVEEGLGGAGNISGKNIVEKVSDSVPSGVKRASDDFVKVSSTKKEENPSIKEGKSLKGKDKESHNSESKSKAHKNNSGEKVKGGKTDGRIHGKRKYDVGSSDDSENEYEKRHPRDILAKDRYADGSRGRSEKESKRKSQNADDERARDRNAGKKRDSRKWQESEFSERREKNESSQFRHEDSRLKRRRSRSREKVKDREHDNDREHDKDRGRSISLSPRAHKRTSNDVGEHGELSSHSSKDRSGRFHSDVDRKRMSSNGSSSHYRGHGVPANRLGGYSPRKRRTEAAVKTPSPTIRSPEKRSAAWDLPPAGTESNFTGSGPSNLLSSNQTVSSNTQEFSSMVPVTSNTPKPVVGVVSSAPPSKINASFDSIQLTQATRPMRRLYVENVPASSSEEAVMECLNNFLLSSGVNLIQGTRPCISCIIHKEKGQALVEFLTPEDASAALSFDGRSFSGSILKIRRPKDYVEEATGVLEKSGAEVQSISDVVKDSPHKIFIGGISKVISSEMLLQIASAFGPLKAYRFEVIRDVNEQHAFLEYVDQSVTSKACAALNGMRLGGQVLTVVQAIPIVSSVENIGNPPFYGIPEHVKPLLEKPTQVLKLKNVLDPNGLLSLSEPELEEILEDIRLECARFGTVKSVNVIKHSNCSTTAEAYEVTDNTGSAMDGNDVDCDDKKRVEILGEDTDQDAGKVGASNANELEVKNAAGGSCSCDDKLSSSEPSSNAREPEEVNKAMEGDGICDDKLGDNLVKDEICDPSPDYSVEDPTFQDKSGAVSEVSNQLNTLIDQLECLDHKSEDILQLGDLDMENQSSVKEELKSEEDNGKLVPASSEAVTTELDAVEKGENKEQVSNPGDVFEPGCVLVEYRRAEASCTAAHCLHGRLFDDRIVIVGYVARDLYRARFPK